MSIQMKRAKRTKRGYECDCEARSEGMEEQMKKSMYIDRM